MTAGRQMATHLARLGELTGRLERACLVLTKQPDATADVGAEDAAKILKMGVKKFNRLVRLRVIRPVPGKKRQRRYLIQNLLDYKKAVRGT